jgi:hypothetical protein
MFIDIDIPSVPENGKYYLISYHIDLMNAMKLRKCDKV